MIGWSGEGVDESEEAPPAVEVDEVVVGEEGDPPFEVGVAPPPEGCAGGATVEEEESPESSGWSITSNRSKPLDGDWAGSAVEGNASSVEAVAAVASAGWSSPVEATKSTSIWSACDVFGGLEGVSVGSGAISATASGGSIGIKTDAGPIDSKPRNDGRRPRALRGRRRIGGLTSWCWHTRVIERSRR